MTSGKRQDLPAGLRAGLWVVATPIGNLGDLSPRARAALGAADAILCEDTRRTQTLVSTFALDRRLPELRRLDAHASPRDVEICLERLRAGESLALVTDAGTPGISDPGAALTARALAEGLVVIPVPGPSAPVALMSVAGFAETEWAFLGFFPRKSGDRRRELDRVERAGETDLCRVFAWFEAPSRIVDALDAVAGALPDALVVAAKEMTKIHERFFRGGAIEIATAVREHVACEGEVGEWCFALRLPTAAHDLRAADGGADLDETGAEAAGRTDSSEWVKALRCLIAARVPAPEAAKLVHREFGVARNDVYSKAISLSGKKNGKGC